MMIIIIKMGIILNNIIAGLHVLKILLSDEFEGRFLKRKILTSRQFKAIASAEIRNGH